MKLVALLLQNGDGVRLCRPVESNEAGREPPRAGRATRTADEEMRARPGEPAADVVGKPTSLRLDDKAKERFLGHVRCELGVARRPQSRAVDRGRMVTEGRCDHLADRRRIATVRAERKRVRDRDAVSLGFCPGEHHRASRSMWRTAGRSCVRLGFDIVPLLCDALMSPPWPPGPR